MHRVLFVLIALSFVGSLVGCKSGGLGCDSGCGDSCGISRRASSCSTGGCGSGGCGTGGCSTGRCALGGAHAHSHGICDCEYDDYCLSRAPWVRLGFHANGSAPIPAGESIPAPLPSKNLPEVKNKKL
jgi:hypothetical protein